MVLLGPSLILLLIPLDVTRKIYRQWSSFVALMWFAFATLLLERLAKVGYMSVLLAPMFRWHDFYYELLFRFGFLSSEQVSEDEH